MCFLFDFSYGHLRIRFSSPFDLLIYGIAPILFLIMSYIYNLAKNFRSARILFIFSDFFFVARLIRFTYCYFILKNQWQEHQFLGYCSFEISLVLKQDLLGSSPSSGSFIIVFCFYHWSNIIIIDIYFIFY